MWGERGLVATLFQDLGADDTFGRWNQFLQRIDFPINRLTQARTIIEPDFSQFGKPDAISLLVEGDKRYVLVTEAKRAPYIQSARHRHERGLRGFNSSINGQLELNHRLALALSDFLPEMGPPLVEPEWILETTYLVPQIGVPAQLWNPVVLDQVVARFEFFGLVADHYCHLFITTDRVDPRVAGLPEFFQPILLSSPLESVSFTAPQFLWANWSNLRDLFDGEAFSGLWPTRFPPTYEVNHPNLMLPRTPAGAPNGWDNRGVALVALSESIGGIQAEPASYLHLSWRSGSAVLRRYDPQYAESGPLELANIIPLIVGPRIPMPAAGRPRVDDHRAWRDLIAVHNEQLRRAGQS